MGTDRDKSERLSGPGNAGDGDGCGMQRLARQGALLVYVTRKLNICPSDLPRQMRNTQEQAR